jgi:hypothetical protein
LKIDVELEHPVMLEEAMALAPAYEQHMSMTKSSPARSSPLQQSTPGRNFGTGRPLLLPAPAPASDAKDAAPAAPRLKRLTVAEMTAKREKGECYNCTEKFSCEHLKTCPMKGIYLLQMDEDTPLDDTAEAEDRLISLSAITSLAAAYTMQLSLRPTNQTLSALVDSGSTHSFISVAAASRLHLGPLPLPSLRVKVANGDHVVTAGFCCKARIYINLEEFILNHFVIPFDDYDMVLGVHWLRTLGPILWDFAHVRMSCWHDDHHVVWQGIVGHHTVSAAHSIAATDLMGLLLSDFDDVFARQRGCHHHTASTTTSICSQRLRR